MKFQATVLLAIFGSASAIKQVVNTSKDSVIEHSNLSVTLSDVRPIRNLLRGRYLQDSGDGEGGDGNGGDGDGGDGEGGDGDGGDGEGGDGDGGDGEGGDGDGGDGDGGDGEGGDGNGGDDGCPGDGEGGDGEGGDGDGGDGEGGDGDGGDGEGGDGDGGDGEGGDGDGGDGEGGDGDGGDGEGGDGEGGDGEGGDGDGGDGEGGDGDGGDGVGGDGDGGDGDGGDGNGGNDCDDSDDFGAFPDLCFSGKNTVEVIGQGMVPMDTLKIGDSVRVMGGSFAKVYSFGHYNNFQKSDYLQIQTTEGNTLEITPKHMVFVNSAGTTKSIPAASIKVGDTLATNKDTTAKVSKIGTVQRKGAYAPFTMSGDIVVSGIASSNYISIMPEEELSLPVSMQWIAHTFNAPHRFVCTAIDFGICENETYTQEGLSTWIALPYHAAEWLAHQSSTVKFIGSATLVATMTLGPIISSLLTFGLLYKKNKKVKAA